MPSLHYERPALLHSVTKCLIFELIHPFKTMESVTSSPSCLIFKNRKVLTFEIDSNKTTIEGSFTLCGDDLCCSLEKEKDCIKFQFSLVLFC